MATVKFRVGNKVTFKVKNTANAEVFGALKLYNEATLAIVSGSITGTSNIIKTQAETGVTDNLTDVTTTVGLLFLRGDTGDTITVIDHGSDVANKFRTLDGSNVDLPTNAWMIFYRKTTSEVWRQVGGGSGVTDHGALTGLGDDDHTQYVLADGSRTMTSLTTTGDITGGTTFQHDESASTTKVNNLGAIAALIQLISPLAFNFGSGAKIYEVGVTPTAQIHLAGVTASAGSAPLKLEAGTVMTTPENGAIENDGTHLYVTLGGTRYQLDQQSGLSGGTASRLAYWTGASSLGVGSYYDGTSVNHGDTSAVSSAILAATSTSKGFLKPVMTMAQMNAISSPATGLELINSTWGLPMYYNGQMWSAIQPAIWQRTFCLMYTGAGSVPLAIGTSIVQNGSAAQSVLGNLVFFKETESSGNGRIYTSTTTGAFYSNFGLYYHALLHFEDASYDQTGASTGTRLAYGFYSSNGAYSSDDPAGHRILFVRLHTNAGAQHTTWYISLKDGSTENLIDTTVTFTVSKTYEMLFRFDGTTCYWAIRNVTDSGSWATGSTSSNVPSSTALHMYNSCTSVNSTSRTWSYHQIYGAQLKKF